MILPIIFSFAFCFATQANETVSQQPQDKIGSSLQSMTSFAKNSLITNTDLAKKEFAYEEEQPNVKVEDQYKTAVYRDIFFTINESALINQALDYYKQGKKMYPSEPKKSYKVEKVEKVRKPLIKLSSVMYKTSEMWSVFTSVGKFSDDTPSVKNFEITGISKDEVEFTAQI